jgi:hypothetical protein
MPSWNANGCRVCRGEVGRIAVAGGDNLAIEFCYVAVNLYECEVG